MATESPRSQQDEKTLLSIVEQISRSKTGAESTKHWAEKVLWFDIPPFASRGVEVARKELDREFAKVQSLEIEILETETFLNVDMGVVCSVQRWKVVTKAGVARPPCTCGRRTASSGRRGDGR